MKKATLATSIRPMGLSMLSRLESPPASMGIERHEGPVRRIALAQPARIEVVAVLDDALEPDAVELAIGLQRADVGAVP